MLSIKEIAPKLTQKLSIAINDDEAVEFAEALISAYKAELLNEVGEPFAYYDPDLGCGSAGISFDPLSDGIYLYTSNQVAAAILKVTKPLKEEVARYRGKSIANADRTEAYLYENQELRAQLAKAEQRVAEACALQVATETRLHWLDAARVAKEIRSGEWRKFMKEV